MMSRCFVPLLQAFVQLVLLNHVNGAILVTSTTPRTSSLPFIARWTGSLFSLLCYVMLVTLSCWKTRRRLFGKACWYLLLNRKLEAFKMLRAASESSRSSYYSLHMEGSGKLELRWESNITICLVIIALRRDHCSKLCLFLATISPTPALSLLYDKIVVSHEAQVQLWSLLLQYEIQIKL